MITVDLISPGGAFTPAANGNTQEITTTFSIASSTNTLTCNGATPFVSGDIGKYFMIRGAGSSGESSQWLFGTISGFTSSSVVTLSANATNTLSTTSARMIWGSDDSPAIRAFNTWAQSQTDSITVTLGSGAKGFIFASSDSTATRGGGMCWNVSYTVRVVGNGGVSGTTKFYYTTVFRAFSFVSSTHLKTGTGVYPGILNNGVAYLDSASAGDTSVKCKTPSDATGLFTAGKWAMISGLDTMGTGSPPNPFLYEYVLPTNVNGTTGIITLQDPLQNSYLDTWPVFTVGDAVHDHHGGPATLYAMDDGWGTDATFEGILLDLTATGGQTYSKGYKMTFRDIKLIDGNGLIPSGSKDVEFYDCDLSTYQQEIDKITEYIKYDNTQTGQLRFQSSVNRCDFVNGSSTTSGGFNGTPRFLNIQNSTVGNVIVGASSYGRDDSFVTTGSTFNGTFGYSGISDQGDNTGSLQTDYTFSSSGVIQMPKAGRTAGPGLRWALPGTRCYFSGQETSSPFRVIDWGPGFTVLSVTADSTYIYVQTDWPYTNGFPSWAKSIKVVGSKYLSLASDTVSSTGTVQQLVAATAAGYTAPGRYISKTLNGATCGTQSGSGSIAIPPITGGKLISMKINVTTPYTGVLSSLGWFKGGDSLTGGWVLAGDGSSILSWNPAIDLRTAGLRTITPSGVTGAAGTDQGLALPASDAWLSYWLQGMGTGSVSIISEYNGNNAVGPVFDVELILDQGFAETASSGRRVRFRVR